MSRRPDSPKYNHMNTSYTLPEEIETGMVNEPMVATQQYAADLRYGMAALSKATPEELHNIVVYLKLQEDTSIKEQFNELFDRWISETIIYSGPNLCYDNENYRALKTMGTKILPLIDLAAVAKPDYMQRHIQWLKKGIQA